MGEVAGTSAALPQGTARWLRNYYQRAGALPATLATALVAVAASLVLTTVALLLVGTPPFGRLFWIGLGISVAIPMLVAPPVVWTVMHMLHELTAARGAVEKLAITDALTGACNRRHFHAIGALEFERARRSGTPLALLMLDLDDFKQVNDVHGHLVGDSVLQAVGQACLAGMRPYDVVARYGGEELVVLLPATASEGAKGLAERLRARIAALRVATAEGGAVRTTASIGVAELDATMLTLEALFARADAAMYRAKRAGKNCVATG